MLGGAVVYSNGLKTAFADVPAALIAQRGAVSAEVAEALASGIRGRAGSDLGIGITGIAGPGGGSAEKPVGTVYVGIATPAGVSSQHLHLPGGRASVRVRTCATVAHLLRQQLASG